jgi:hypothetical protein
MRTPLFAATLLTLIAADAQAQTQTWRVISATNNIIATPGFAGSPAPNFFRYSLLDSGNSVVVGQISAAPNNGRWVRRQGSFVRYAQLDTTGTVGPNRQGAEAGHVFRSLRSGDDRLGSDSNIAILGLAGAPGASTGSLPNAAWRFNGSVNNEYARALVDTQLGPNLGAGWFFADEALISHPQADGSILVFSNITSPTNFTRRGVVKNTVAGGNVTCALVGSTLPALSPNIGNSNPFNSISSVYSLDGNRTFMFANTQIGATESGVWEICNGAPIARVLTARTGALGPSVPGLPNATFVEIITDLRNGGNGEFLFSASYRESAISIPRGLFRQKNGANNLIAKLDDTTAALGPNWLGSTFSRFENESLIGAGQHVAFEANVFTPQNTTVTGIFRIRPGGNPEPVVLAEILAFGPGTGQTFARFDRWILLANGDIIADCAVNNGPSGLYRFRTGQAPQLLMAAGTIVPVQTTTGLVQASVVSYEVPVVEGDSAQSSYSWSGYESWAATDGTLLVGGTINVAGTNVGALMVYNIDINAFLKDGFE